MSDVDTAPFGPETVGTNGDRRSDEQRDPRTGFKPTVSEQRERTLAAKLSLPHQGFVLCRPRLRASLEPVFRSGGVVSVVAGPGCGKTSFIVDLLSSATGRTAYYAIDEDDRDPVRFLRYLMFGLGHEPSESSSSPVPGWSGCDADAQALDLAAELVDVMSRMRLDRHLLALDDVHLLEDSQPAVAALELVLRGLPPGWTVLLSSRRKPSFQIDPVKIGGRLVRIAGRDLRLTPTEVSAWAKHNWGVVLQASEARSLWQLTEGWPAGLSLLGQRMHSFKTSIRRGDIVRLLARGVGLRMYLERDVLSGLNVFARELVFEAALLPRVVFPRDETFLPGEPGQAEETLNDLVDQGFLVSRLSTRIFAVHPLIRALAERQAQRTKGKEALTKRAAEHLERNGELHHAASLYLRNGQAEAAIRPIQSLGLIYLTNRESQDYSWACETPGQQVPHAPHYLQ